MNIRETDIYEEGKNDGIAQGISQGISQGAEQAKIETAKNMLLKFIPVDVIAECTGLTIETVQKLVECK